LNRFKEEDAGKHWGYPYCWTEFKLPEPPGLGNGAVWAWPSFLDNGAISDDQCRQDFVPSMVSMQGHSAPLGITFYRWKPPGDLPEECGDSFAFPPEMDGFAFVAFHGSFDRDVPTGKLNTMGENSTGPVCCSARLVFKFFTGYKAVYIPMDADGNPSGSPVDLLAHEPPNAKWDNGFRPVDVSFDDCGRLLLSSDGTSGRGSSIVRIGYNGTGKEESMPPSTLPSNSPTNEKTALTFSPSPLPSLLPTSFPSILPSNSPSNQVTTSPTSFPSLLPSNSPSNQITTSPTPFPSSGVSVSGIVAILVSVMWMLAW
jgi:hypothetical protein